jgi:hypothetical protein
LPQREYELEMEGEFEVNPVRKIYPDAMLEHLGHAAAEAQGEAEAEALASAMLPVAADAIPAASPALIRAMPGLVSAVSGVVRQLYRDPATRPLIRVIPAIVRRTAASLGQRAARGGPLTPQAAVRALAQQTLRLLGSPEQSARAFRRSQALDRHFHRTAVPPAPVNRACPSCGARTR